jgi:hypothetical protein
MVKLTHPMLAIPSEVTAKTLSNTIDDR